MKDRIQQLEKDFEVAKESLQRMRDKLDELKDSEEEFEEGQYWICEDHIDGRHMARIAKMRRGEPLFDKVIDSKEECPQVYLPSWIKRPATKDEIKEALIAEAKRRGYTLDNFRCIVLHTDNMSELRWRYDADTDILFMGHNAVYVRGQWAEKIEDTITINGVECEALKGRIKLSCGDTIPNEVFGSFSMIVHKYDLTVHRQGEDITPQIKKLGQQI